MLKQKFLALLRKLNLLHIADRLNYFRQKIANYSSNKAFKQKHPDVKLPPDYLMYESFSLNYESYYKASRQAAKDIADKLKDHLNTEEKVNILDWGCGPGRIIRHMPDFFVNAEIYGTDYNSKSITWCHNNLQGINFSVNLPDPPLSFDDNTFDAIYGISIFTHLSEPMHDAWMKELIRVLKPGGIMYQSTHGDATKIRLNEDEKELYDKGEIVVRGKVVEGHRIYTAYHPPVYMRDLIKSSGGKVAEHIPGTVVKRIPPKDIWLITKD